MSRFLTYEDVAEKLDVKIGTVRKWVQQNRIPYTRIGPQVIRFDEDRITEWQRKRSELLTYQDIADMLGLAVSTVMTMVQQSRIPHIRITPQQVRFDKKQINEWLKANTFDGNGDRDTLSLELKDDSPKESAIRINLLTYQELAEKTSIDEDTLATMVRDGLIPYCHFQGNVIRFNETEIDRWIRDARVPHRVPFHEEGEE